MHLTYISPEVKVLSYDQSLTILSMTMLMPIFQDDGIKPSHHHDSTLSRTGYVLIIVDAPYPGPVNYKQK